MCFSNWEKQKMEHWNITKTNGLILTLLNGERQKQKNERKHGEKRLIPTCTPINKILSKRYASTLIIQ